MNYFGKKNSNYDKILYTFLHKDGNLETDITQFNFRNKYKISSCNVSKLISKKNI